MRLSQRFLRTVLATLAILSFLNLTAHRQAFAGSESVLWSFGNGTDGLNPEGGLIADKNGNLYGTTYEGGAFACQPDCDVGGTVFELTPPATSGGDWAESILWSFGHGTDGNRLGSTLVMDAAGNLYGSATGGVHNGGIVFELTPPSTMGGNWTESILWDFGKGKDAAGPSSLIIDTAGNLYGATCCGGAYGESKQSSGYGTAFKLTPPLTAGGIGLNQSSGTSATATTVLIRLPA